MGLTIFIVILFITLILRTVILSILSDKHDISAGKSYIKQVFNDARSGIRYMFGRKK